MYGGRGSGPEFQRNQMSRPQMEPAGGGRSMVQDSPRGYSRPPLEMRQPIVTPRSSEVRGSAPRESLLHEVVVVRRRRREPGRIGRWRQPRWRKSARRVWPALGLGS